MLGLTLIWKQQTPYNRIQPYKVNVDKLKINLFVYFDQKMKSMLNSLKLILTFTLKTKNI